MGNDIGAFGGTDGAAAHGLDVKERAILVVFCIQCALKLLPGLALCRWGHIEGRKNSAL